MLNTFENVLVMLATMAAAVGFLFLVRRLWPTELRREHNDLIGWNVTVLGSTYAVIIAFMLFSVWNSFQTADSNAEAEANCLVNLARYSRGLAVGQHTQVLNLAREYANVMVTKEWPAMDRCELSPASHPIVRQLWATLLTTETHPGLEQTSLERALSELARMTEYRWLRQSQINASLPGILWFVLIVGATITIMSACLFGTPDFLVHLVQVTMLALLISATLVAIADIYRPFQGAVHVNPAGFERARLTLSDAP